MANYTTSQDLVDDILFRAGEPTDGTSDFDAAALRYLNAAYQAIWMGGGSIDPTLNESWWWLKKDPPGTLVLEPNITAGTVAITNSSASITFSTGPTPTVAGYFIHFTGDNDIFRVITHTATQTGATLDTAYTGSTDGASNYTLFKLEYDLASDVMRVIAPMRTFNQPTRVRLDHEFDIVGTELPALEQKYPLANATSSENPDVFAMVGDQKVRFNRYPAAQIHVEYDYLAEPVDLTDGAGTPLVPRQWRKVLSDVAVMFLLTDKNDSRAVGAAQLALNGLRSMAIENRERQIVIRSKSGIISARFGPALNRDAVSEALGVTVAQANRASSVVGGQGG